MFMDARVLDSRASWLRLALTLLIAAFGNVGMWSIILLLPEIEASFGLSRVMTTLTFVATMLGFALGNVVSGRMADRYGIVRTLLVSGLMVGLGHIMVGVAPLVLLVCFGQFAIGLGTAGFFAPLMADISHWFMKRRGIALAIAASGNYLSGVIWPLLLAPAMAAYGWRLAYGGMGFVLLLFMLPLALTLAPKVPMAAMEAADRVAKARAGGVGLSPARLQMLLVIAGICCCVAMSMPQVHIVAYCIDLGFGPSVGAEMLSLMLVGGIVSRLVSGVVADRLGGLVTLLAGSFLQMVALCLYLPFDGLVPLYVVSLIFGLSQGGIVPSYAVIIREYMPASEAGSRVGLVMMSTLLGMALGGWLSGLIYDVTGSYMVAFLNGIAWNLVNLGIILLILWRSQRLPNPPQAGKAAPSH